MRDQVLMVLTPFGLKQVPAMTAVLSLLFAIVLVAWFLLRDRGNGS